MGDKVEVILFSRGRWFIYFLISMLALKNPVGGSCYRVRSQKTWWELVLTVFALKNPGEGVLLGSLSKKPGFEGFSESYEGSRPEWWARCRKTGFHASGCTRQTTLTRDLNCSVELR